MTRIQAGPLHSLGETHTSDRGTIHGEDQERSIPIFQRIADKVSYGMGTPVNIAVWILLVVVWTVLFATQLVPANGSFLPSWFTSTGYNFPLNLVTKIAELYIGFLVGASANRSERNLEATLARIDQQEKQIRAVEGSLSAALMENTQLTKAVKMNTDLLQEIRDQVRTRREPAGQKR